LRKRNVHEAGYDSMLTAIAFLKTATHIEEGGKLPKEMRGHIEHMSLRLASALTNPVQDLFPSKGPVRRRGPFYDFFDIEDEEQGPQAEEPVLQTSPLALADTGSKEITEKVQNKLFIPRLGSEFWHTYGNRLCAFAAFERTVYLGPTEKPVNVMKKTEPNDVNREANHEKVVKTGVLIRLD
jgi:poly(A)-specific ribonuclease